MGLSCRWHWQRLAALARNFIPSQHTFVASAPLEPPAPASNPFSTAFVRPGALPFLWGKGESPQTVIERLAAQGWWGQIVGAHGSGKSTLLAELIANLSPEQRVRIFELHDGQRSLGVPLSRLAEDGTTLIVVDGYEQLWRWNRWRLRSQCRRDNLGLLVTAHADMGLPWLYCTTCDQATALAVVERLLSDCEGEQDEALRRTLIDHAAAAYHRHGGNCRELLFELYDVYEALR